MSLKKQAVNSAFWGTLNSVGNQGIQFLFGLILARLLTPNDYSVIGILTIFLSLSTIFIDSGMGSALIRKKNVSSSEYSTVFYFNIAVAMFFYIVIFLSANYIESFFEINNLAIMVRVFCIKIILESLAMIQGTIFIKNLDFKRIAIISFISGIIGGIVGLYYAYYDYKAWALIFQTLAYSSVYVILHWSWSSWRPKLIFSMRDFKETFGYSSKLLGASLAGRLVNEINSIIIGKYLPPDSLGLYTKANSFKNLPSSTINTVISKVSLPILAQLEKDSSQYVNFVKKIIITTCYLSFGLLLMLVAIAPNFIPFLIGDQWKDSVIIFQLISFVGMVFPLQAITGNILNSYGKSDLIMKSTWIKSIIYIVVLFWAVFGGIKVFAATMSILALFSFFFNNYFLRKVIDISSMDQIKLIWKFVLTFVLSSLITWLIGDFLKLGYFTELLIQIPTYITLSLGASILFKFDALKELISLFQSFRQK